MEAERQVDDLKKKGFRAFMLTPTPEDPNPFYRVQVGAADPFEAGRLKEKLEAAGFNIPPQIFAPNAGAAPAAPVKRGLW